MTKSVEQKINQIFWALFKKCFDDKTIDALSRGNKRAIRRRILRLKSSKEFDDFAKKFSKELAKQGIRGTKTIWKKYYEIAKKSKFIALDVSYGEYEYNVMKNAIKHNFKMIKSIPNEFLEILNHKYTSVLIEQVAKGSLGRNSFKALLEKHGHRNAKLIARTETAKLQTAILRERSTQLGSVAYIWLASNDKRTRKSHRAMNKVVVFWNHEKPRLDKMIGHAGEFPNCRCSPQPILDADDLTQHTYKVYNYNTHEVVSMTKNKLIESIKNNKI